MTSCDHDAACLVCARTDAEVPVLRVRYRGAKGWICSDCLPRLIHERADIAESLSALEHAPGDDAHV